MIRPYLISSRVKNKRKIFISNPHCILLYDRWLFLRFVLVSNLIISRLSLHLMLISMWILFTSMTLPARIHFNFTILPFCTYYSTQQAFYTYLSRTEPYSIQIHLQWGKWALRKLKFYRMVQTLFLLNIIHHSNHIILIRGLGYPLKTQLHLYDTHDEFSQI